METRSRPTERSGLEGLHGAGGVVEAVSMAEKLQKQSVMRRGHEDLGRHGRRLRSREEPGGMAEVEEEERGSVGPLLGPC